jgi:V8-like Glu-specific endopeptidase
MLFTFSFSVLALAAPADAGATRKVRSSAQAPASVRAAARVWTEAQMLAATPMERRRVPARTTGAGTGPLLAAAPGRVPGRAPLSRVRASEGPDREEPARVAASEAEDLAGPLSYTYPAPYSSYEVFQYTKYPFSTVGRIFFTQNGVDYACSASVIGPYTIWTAALCLHDGSGTATGWSYNLVFVPAYKSGARPFGQWPMQAAGSMVTESWYANGASGDYTYDFGGATLKKIVPPGDTVKRSISYVTGYLGFLYNAPTQQHWFAIGYPVVEPFTAPYNGQRMYNCAASYAYSDTTFSPNTTGIGCGLPGVNGGPWIVGLSPKAGASNYLNGSSSYRYSGFAEELYSPYFDDNAKSMWDCLQVATPANPDACLD